jgi:hypothetical protein
MAPRPRVPHEEAQDPVMAKRARGSVRPGQRRPIDRRPAASSAAGSTAAAAPKPVGLTDDEAARAAELERQLLAQERQATETRARARERSTREAYVGTGGSIAVRAEVEYAYVARDIRRIAFMAVFMLTVLFALWIVIDVAKVFTIS